MTYTGLTTAQAAASRAAEGGNELTGGRRRGFFRQFLSGFGDPIIKVLLAALGVNVLFFFHRFDWFESVGIALAILLSTFVSALSERGSESAFEKLQEESARVSCPVYRDGNLTALPIGEIVAGDAVRLGTGERIPADGVLLEGELTVDQSALNGESREVIKRPGGAFTGDLSAPGELFRGSVILAGGGVMRVTRVGSATLFGKAAGELRESQPDSPLKTRLAGLAKSVSRLGYGAAALVAAADLFHSFIIDNGFSGPAILAALSSPAGAVSRLLHALTLAVTMIVVAVPEGLPMMITVVLSANIRKMLRDKVLVRRPVGIETAGCLNVLFTDKTGTLTAGRLQPAVFLCGDGETFDAARIRGQPLWSRIARGCLVNSESALSHRRAVGGNATDRALTEWAALSPIAGEKAIRRIPFDSARKYAAVQLAGEPLTLIKGAPEILLPACTGCYGADGVRRPLSPALAAAWRRMTEEAMRVIALAEYEGPLPPEGRFENLTLVGMVGIRDRVRPGVKRAVETVRRAGVQVVMITGDNMDTARAAAREAGVLTAADGQEACLSGEELSALPEEELRRRLPRLRVIARALPVHKSRLVRAAQDLGLVAGMTGDGVNDAPALKRADVGFAMGSGTEVAKEAGDVVILDDNFASITRAILYGRTVFKSIRKFILFQLTMNLCAMGVSVIGPFIGVETPVTVIQMLWINLIMDTLAGLAFAGEPPLPEYMEEPPLSRAEPVLSRGMLRQILLTGGYTLGLCILFLKWEPVKGLFRYDLDPLFRMSAFFALFIFCGIANAFNARSGRAHPFANLRRNPAFILIMGAVAVIQLFLLYFGGSLFRTAPLTAAELCRVLLLATSVIPASSLFQLMKRGG